MNFKCSLFLSRISQRPPLTREKIPTSRGRVYVCLCVYETRIYFYYGTMMVFFFCMFKLAKAHIFGTHLHKALIQCEKLFSHLNDQNIYVYIYGCTVEAQKAYKRFPQSLDRKLLNFVISKLFRFAAAAVDNKQAINVRKVFSFSSLPSTFTPLEEFHL